MDLLREQIKMLAGEVALSTSSLKRLSEQASKNPGDSRLLVSFSHIVASSSISNHTVVFENYMLIRCSDYGKIRMSKSLIH